jgi:hypothetical protein
MHEENITQKEMTYRFIGLGEQIPGIKNIQPE